MNTAINRVASDRYTITINPPVPVEGQPGYSTNDIQVARRPRTPDEVGCVVLAKLKPSDEFQATEFPDLLHLLCHLFATWRLAGAEIGEDNTFMEELCKAIGHLVNDAIPDPQVRVDALDKAVREYTNTVKEAGNVTTN